MVSDPMDWAEKREFFRQLGEAVREQNHVWLLIAMREEYVPALDPYLNWLPHGLAARYRLWLLNPESAREVIVRSFGWGISNDERISEDAVSAILAELTKRDSGTDFSSADSTYDFVEPMHLQVVCERQWNRTGERRISTQDVEREGNLDDALRGYVGNVIDDRTVVPLALDRDGERRIRRYLDQHLIHRETTRRPVHENDAHDGLGGRYVTERLRELYLLQIHQLRDQLWIELAHDRLVPAVLKANEAWYVAWEQRAREWTQQGKPDGKLLSLGELRVAPKPSSVSDPDDREFLERSKDRVKRFRRGRLRKIGISAAVVMLVVGFFYYTKK